MKMLVPVDGSAASIEVVKKAIAIAKKYDFSMKLVTVINHDNSRRYRRNEQLWRQVDGSILTNRSLFIDDDEYNGKLHENSIQLLESIKNELDFEGITLDTEVLSGEAYNEILETAKKESFDLIVMGNRGFSNIKSFFVGSVTQRVVSEAPCPVLVIHADAE